MDAGRELAGNVPASRFRFISWRGVADQQEGHSTDEKDAADQAQRHGAVAGLPGEEDGHPENGREETRGHGHSGHHRNRRRRCRWNEPGRDELTAQRGLSAKHEFQHAFLQLAAAPAQTLHDRIRSQLERRRHVLDGAMVAIKKNQRLAIDFREAADLAPEDRHLLVAHRLGRRQRLATGQFRRRVEGIGLVRGLPAESPAIAVDDVSRDATEPGTQPARVVQASEFLPGGDKRLLRDVLALAAAAGRAVGESTDEGLVPDDDLPEGVTVAGEALLHQLGVVAAGRGNGNGCHVINPYVVAPGPDLTENRTIVYETSGAALAMRLISRFDLTGPAAASPDRRPARWLWGRV